MGKGLVVSEQLSIHEIEEIMKKASYFKQLKHYDKIQTGFKNKFVANLFFEPSTRTRFSFEVAEKKLGLNVLNFTSDASSIQKGESLYDTLRTLESIGAELAVIRIKEEGLLHQLENKTKLKIINAGEGTKEHPTQALLDLFTIKTYFHDIKGLNIAIIGDIAHSRVAHSNFAILKKLGANIIYSGPEYFMDKEIEGKYLPIDDAIKAADVVMMLRIQFERQTKGLVDSIAEYNKKYGFTKNRLELLKSNAIILHPAPVNRGVEMDDEVVEHPQSKIFEQIENGVFIRMAVIERALGGENNWGLSSNKDRLGTKISGF